MNQTFARVHRRGGYFRVLGYGVLVSFTDHPLYGLRRHHHLGRFWWRVLRPVPEGAQFDGRIADV
jgi:hypothetical protein